MQKKRCLGIFLFIFLISITLISSVPPITTEFIGNTGLNIQANLQNYYPINKPAELHIYVFNISNGAIMNSTEVSCYVELTRENGTAIMKGYPAGVRNHFEINRTADIVTDKGTYGLTIVCNNSKIAGYKTGFFEATLSGKGLETSESLTYFVLAFGVLLLFILSFYFMISTPYGNETKDGAVIKLTKLKYVKLGLILLTWILLTWFLNILIGLSDNFVSLTMYYGFFGFIFETMNRLALPLGIIIIVIALFEIVRDANIYENIKKFGSAR